MSKKIKVLNLFAGIGGNRKLWKNVEVTAVENNVELAAIYKVLFPNDKIVVGDAYEYLLNHYKEFDFIWASPSCISHSSFRFNICVRYRGTKPKYPDFKLYELITFLKSHCWSCDWVVENVKPYYKSLIEGKLIQRHMFWSNFDIEIIEFEKDNIRKVQIPQLQEMYGFDLSSFKITNKRQVLRNCVKPELGLHILNCSKQTEKK